jgi:hypothetical protein
MYIIAQRSWYMFALKSAQILILLTWSNHRAGLHVGTIHQSSTGHAAKLP